MADDAVRSGVDAPQDVCRVGSRDYILRTHNEDDSRAWPPCASSNRRHALGDVEMTDVRTNAIP